MFEDANAQKNYILTGTGEGNQVKTNVRNAIFHPFIPSLFFLSFFCL